MGALEVDFHDVPLLVRPGRVMIPRPTTEALVDRALELIRDRRVRVADVGTGSGAIAVALALRAPLAEIWATDTNAAAVSLAEQNAEWHRLAPRVHMLQGNLLDPVPGRLDLVLANLPYLPESELGRADLLGEPPDALFAAGDGLGPYRRLVAQAAGRLKPDGALLVQLRGRVVEAPASELSALPARLPQLAAA
jgi:release factor glutamine methyltransferase